MGQVRVYGNDRAEFLERLVVADLKGLHVGDARLSLFTNEQGGIMDDTIITSQDDYFQLVVNAACRRKDLDHLRLHIEWARLQGLDVSLVELSDYALLALQGPESMNGLQAFVPHHKLNDLLFMQAILCSVAGAQGCTVTRCGYTGEDGFEISVPEASVVAVFRKLLEHESVLPAGLGARDTLRLEAGMCLYGHDCTDDISPIQAALTWTIAKSRRSGESANFLGADKILRELKNGPSRKRVGFLPNSKNVPREGAVVNSEEGVAIGKITSGTFSPTLQRPICMGYVQSDYAKVGTALIIEVRDKCLPAIVTKMPFVKTNYYKP